MAFLYHARPVELRGSVLHPLNALRWLQPDVFQRERAKYEGREALLDFRIPILEVRWNDAVHLAPIHPRLLAAAWAEAGLSSAFWERDFFRIPVERIPAGRSVWFANEAYGAGSGPGLPPEDVRPFEPARYRELDEPPAAYLAFLRERKYSGRPARPFASVPHVLVAAPIDVSGLALVRA